MPKPRNLKQYRPPVERVSLKRMPGDPTPAGIRQRCEEIQANWTESDFLSRQAKNPGGKSIRQDEGSKPVQVVCTRDLSAAARR
ncbi:hypothetical protein ETAA8_06570 [Anatilimnocola aggregata]|uniref:Uncharacterized protein n=1 Tax=Anatilimnocola aggregata TaxID=2528021 RepID=A0A517Y5S1_9BACT|nr:hypothetical protein ETAA8_06570 [Anatilimnocola aggregata]